MRGKRWTCAKILALIGEFLVIDIGELCDQRRCYNSKNYLTDIGLQRLNLLVPGFLNFAEFQVLEMNPMTIKDWIEALDNRIIAHERKVLIGKGNISHKQAFEKAEQEFEIYRKPEMELLESDFECLQMSKLTKFKLPI